MNKKLRKSKHEKEGKDSFHVQTFEQILERANTILDIVKWVIVAIAAISLFVGGIRIINTVYMSVMEKTKQIGVMKAVGAGNRDIMSIFLIESGVLGLVRRVIGCIICLSISKSFELIIAREWDRIY
ncbi:MAG: hypothetical protein B6U72_02430 [Candidatus Altiarchaeales archaeon ex4484_2]|nr:MAG: hypothetical protein B6U72_02430 [Candidatus Altiarchaeales archaeon ex4484_2]